MREEIIYTIQQPGLWAIISAGLMFWAMFHFCEKFNAWSAAKRAEQRQAESGEVKPV